MFDSADYVIEFLKKSRRHPKAAFDRIQYIEQPTSRHLDAAECAADAQAVAAIKPVVIDEALISYESLLLAREQGYSGIALKACKGQTESLLMAAAAQKFGMFLCVQDLTCPGVLVPAFVQPGRTHSRNVAAIEGNARQYCPAANAKWARKVPIGLHRQKRQN
jgi:L-alanine-DL-glutamate epimerase-like enolase superfamily enzyme